MGYVQTCVQHTSELDLHLRNTAAVNVWKLAHAAACRVMQSANQLLTCRLPAA